MSIVLCPKCGLSAKCYCRCLGTSILDRSYEFVLICGNCGHIKTIKDEGCWRGPVTRCPFCGKNYRTHQAPPK